MKTILVDAVDTLIITRDSSWQIYTEMYKLLESYPNRKIMMTGAPKEKWAEYGLDNAPYEFFTLNHNPEKTDPEYFKKFLAQYNLTADDVIYFEHNLDAVKSAESVGIKSYWYDHAKMDLLSLKEFLDTNI